MDGYISLEFFRNKLTDFLIMNNSRLPEAAIEKYHDRLQHMDANAFAKAVDHLCEYPPQRFNFAVLKAQISLFTEKKIDGNPAGHWNGKPCKKEMCEMGLIWFKKAHKDEHGNKNTVTIVQRCPACKSYDAPFIPFYQGVLN